MEKIPKTNPSFKIEKSFWSQGLTVAGVDEVGRGSFAGPVVAAAVIFPKDFISNDSQFSGINDSKLLNPKLRTSLAKFIKSICFFSIAVVSVQDINKFGIGISTRKAILRSAQKLKIKPEILLIDGYALKKLPFKQKSIIRGDKISISIAAASILAKVHRDLLMEKLDVKYDLYDFFHNKGYGTAYHRKMINTHGLSPIHRTSFALAKYVKTLEIPERHTTQ